MAIPISYNVRNLKLRKGLTIMTALGIALTVTTAIFLMALLAGLKRAFVSSGNPQNVLVLRKGSEAELSGGFDAALFPTLKVLPGIAKDSHGEPMVSGEWVVVIVLPRKDGTGEVNVTVRGMMPDGLELRPSAKLIEGRWFQTGQREVVVSKSIRSRFSHANIGDTMEFGKGSWKVVGVFDAGGSAYESEIWSDVNQMAADFDRQGGFSSAYLRATDPIAADALKKKGFSRTYGVNTWESLTITKGNATLTITAMPATHAPGPVKFLMPKVMGSMLEFQAASYSKRLSLYISGDTLLDKNLREIPRRFPDIDLALLHLGGTKVMGLLLTMDGRQGAQALKIIAPEMAIPIHFNDYTVFKSPLEDFKKAVREAKLENKVKYLHHGETYIFDVPVASQK